MGAVPHHPFFLRVVESLQAYDRRWFLPYITVMYSTGPLFLSVVWKEYMAESYGPDRVRVLMPEEYNHFSWSFFTHHVGNSWHGADAQLIFWVSSPRLLSRRQKIIWLTLGVYLYKMCRYWVLLTVIGFALAGCVGFAMWIVYGRLLRIGHRYRYSRVAPGTISVSKLRRGPFSVVPNLLLRHMSSSSISSDEEFGRKEGGYYE